MVDGGYLVVGDGHSLDVVRGHGCGAPGLAVVVGERHIAGRCSGVVLAGLGAERSEAVDGGVLAAVVLYPDVVTRSLAGVFGEDVDAVGLRASAARLAAVAAGFAQGVVGDRDVVAV